MQIISELLELSGQKMSFHCFIVEQPQLEPYWHGHPEIELSLVVRGRGLRFVGDHVGEFSHDDLLLTSSNMPHDRVSDTNLTKKESARVIVLHLSENFWLHYPEYQSLSKLLNEARYGVLFPNPSASLKQQILQLTTQSSLTGLSSIISIFSQLASNNLRQTLSSAAFGEGQFSSPENQRIQMINKHLLDHYHDSISQKQIANKIAMSPQAFSRWFKHTMNCTFIEHLNKIRIEKACLLLVETTQPISLVAAHCGYDSLSNFNKQFSKLKNTTPRQFRRHFSERYSASDQNSLS